MLRGSSSGVKHHCKAVDDDDDDDDDDEGDDARFVSNLFFCKIITTIN